MKFSSNEPLSLSDETSDVMDNPTASSEDTSFARLTKIVLLKALASLKYHNIFFYEKVRLTSARFFHNTIAVINQIKISSMKKKMSSII